MPTCWVLPGLQCQWRERGHVLVGAIWQLFDELLEVAIRLEAMMTTVLDDGVEDGTPPTRVSRSDEEEVLFPKRGGAHGILNLIVINLHKSVLHEDPQPRPLPQGVCDGLTKETFGKVMTGGLQAQEDPVDTLDNGAALMLPN